MSALNQNKLPPVRGGGTIYPPPKIEENDDELRKRLKGVVLKDREDFTMLYYGLVSRVSSYVGIHIQSPEDVKDVIQEIFIGVWKSASGYSEKSSVIAWVLGIARRKIADYYRQKYRRDCFLGPDPLEMDQKMMLEDEGSSREMKKVIDKVYWEEIMKAISQDEKELVYLCFDIGLSYQEIASIQGIPVGTVKSRMFHVRKKLQKLIREVERG